mmetsp:Transcript_41442/g.119381  ORF Transcript_41442/g.119381 Transcript_41442/m.119381 type:complete len:428 (-) Transcript_41442:15-1298(-)
MRGISGVDRRRPRGRLPQDHHRRGRLRTYDGVAYAFWRAIALSAGRTVDCRSGVRIAHGGTRHRVRHRGAVGAAGSLARGQGRDVVFKLRGRRPRRGSARLCRIVVGHPLRHLCIRPGTRSALRRSAPEVDQLRGLLCLCGVDDAGAEMQPRKGLHARANLGGLAGVVGAARSSLVDCLGVVHESHPWARDDLLARPRAPEADHLRPQWRRVGVHLLRGGGGDGARRRLQVIAGLSSIARDFFDGLRGGAVAKGSCGDGGVIRLCVAALVPVLVSGDRCRRDLPGGGGSDWLVRRRVQQLEVRGKKGGDGHEYEEVDRIVQRNCGGCRRERELDLVGCQQVAVHRRAFFWLRDMLGGLRRDLDGRARGRGLRRLASRWQERGRDRVPAMRSSERLTTSVQGGRPLARSPTSARPFGSVSRADTSSWG